MHISIAVIENNNDFVGYPCTHEVESYSLWPPGMSAKVHLYCVVMCNFSILVYIFSLMIDSGSLRNVTALLLTLSSVIVLDSCSVIRIVEVASPSADCAGSGQHFCHDTTIRTSLWQSKNKENLPSGCPNGISRVKLTTKPMDVLLGFITAGFIVKQRIDWDCAQRSGSSDIP